MAKFLVWDETVVNVEKTTAQRILHRPQRKERSIVFDKYWEGDECNFLKIVKTPTEYRMYYNCHAFWHAELYAPKIRIGMLVSQDGIRWERAKINKIDVNGDRENNVIKDSSEFDLDNFIIFYDKNPNCPLNEKYKALAMVQEPAGTMHLYCYVSEDGIDFRRGWSLFGPQPLTDKYRSDVLVFDSPNVAFWDEDKQKYVVYFRGIHDIPNNGAPGNDMDRNLGVRDIRYAESTDFKNWTQPQRLVFDKPDYPLYTNCVSKYGNVYIGFPTRYNERKEWDDSFDELCGAEERKGVIEKYGVPRYGLAITDCLFMYSYDGKSWRRFDEAYYTPGSEGDFTWLYGSCYPCIDFVETKDVNGEYGKLSLFLNSHTSDEVKCEMYRYEIRKDGFLGYYGDYDGKTLTTNALDITGDEMFVNFATSAAGHIQITLTDESGQVFKSQKHFGDSVNRKIKFDNKLSLLKGKIVMTVELKDAHLYSFEVK